MRIIKSLSRFARNSLIELCLVCGIGGLESRLDAKDILVPSQYSKIQDAVNSASAGDRILVAPGTYIEQISLKSGVTVQGEDRETTEIKFNNDAVVATNIEDSCIRGFTITSSDGNGINMYNSYLEIRDNIIQDSKKGNGIYARVGRSSTVNLSGVINNVIENNKRGIHYWANVCDANLIVRGTIWNNIVSNNSGEGILLEASSNCMGSNKCEPWVINNVIYGNESDGIKLNDQRQYGSTPYISNNIIAKNKGVGINNDQMTPTVAYNDVWDNTGGDYNNTASLAGSISADPQFVNPNSGDFHLQAGSPCIDAGRPTNAPLEDIDLNVRPQCRDYDMGIDEYVYPSVKFKRGDTNFSGSVNIADAVCILSYLFGSGASSVDCKDRYTRCKNAFDSNSDGTVNLADAIKVLGHLFGNTGDLPEPFKNCGNGSAKYNLGCGCEDYSPCNN